MKDSSIRDSFYILTGIIAIIFGLLLVSCSTQYIPVESVKTEIVHNTDTVIVKDTIKNEKETIIREATPADSLMLAEVGLQLDKNKQIILLLQKELAEKSHKEIEHSTDTVSVEKEIKVPYLVEKKLTKWQQLKQDIGGLALLILCVVVFIVLLRWFIKNKLKK